VSPLGQVLRLLQSFPAGVHICQVFNDDAQREETLLKYLLSGVQGGERVSCSSEKVGNGFLAEYFGSHEIDYADLARQALTGQRQVGIPH
jgi:hypothetical protein